MRERARGNCVEHYHNSLGLRVLGMRGVEGARFAFARRRIRHVGANLDELLPPIRVPREEVHFVSLGGLHVGDFRAAAREFVVDGGRECMSRVRSSVVKNSPWIR